MSFATRSDLQNAVLGLRVEQAGRFADFLTLAEQRIYYGGLPDAAGRNMAPPIRVREMEATSPITITTGAGTLPTGYLDKRLAYWVGAQTVEVPYEAPESFYPGTAARVGSPYPYSYTVEGNAIKLSPAMSGTLQFLHYAKAETMVNPETNNVLLLSYPDLYFHGCQIELYRHTRNDGRRAASERDYIAAALAANQATLAARTGGGAIRKRSGWRGP